MILDFDPDNPSEVEAAYNMIKAIYSPAKKKASRNLAGLSSYQQLAVKASSCYGPDEQFSFAELSDKIDVELKTILAHWRNLSKSKEGSEIFKNHGGNPNTYSIPLHAWETLQNYAVRS